MNIFEIRKQISDEYRKYVQSFLSIGDNRIREFVEDKILNQNILWPDALIQLNPAYESADSVTELVNKGFLHDLCDEIFHDEKQSIQLYRHQQDAIMKALNHQHFIVTSGTGSGKSLTYLVPIFDHILKHNPQEQKVHAIIVYPMNALVNSQEKSIEKLLGNLGSSKDIIRVEKYTGQESEEQKQKLRTNPPHVILTNYVMLELMLTRPHERIFTDKKYTSLSFMVLDELHTYRGRQGADVAILIRRLRERCGNPNLLCIGTSATMATGESREERRAAVTEFAGKLFGVQVESDNVIEETLRKAIPNLRNHTSEDLRHSLQEPLPTMEWNDFIANPLGSWIEDNFGLIEEDNSHLIRRKPITLIDGAEMLSKQTGIDLESCAGRLRDMLLIGSKTKNPNGDPAFAFKLHQFISQGGSVYATIEPSEKRLLTMDGQYYAPGNDGKLLYPLLFCRVCGQEYYEAEWHQESNDVLPYYGASYEDIGDEVSEVGYIMPDPDGKWQDSRTNLPDHWFDRNGRSQPNYRPYHPKQINIDPKGKITANDSNATSCWFIRKPFMLCLNCGEAYTLRDGTSDYRKLTHLSSEGRSTSTTLLTLSAVSAMRNSNLDPSSQKILSFTDNRQDASLQSGHFNDFIQVALIRSALCGALETDDELRYDSIASSVIKVLGLSLSEIARQPELDDRSPKARETHEVFNKTMEYRIYEDLRRGWRIVQPNLEQCGLLRIDYKGLNELSTQEDIWSNVLLLSEMSPQQRVEILKAILDEMRRRLAIEADCLDYEKQKSLVSKSREYLNDYWAFDEGEQPRYASRFILPMPDNEKLEGDASLSQVSVIGKWLCKKIDRRLPAEEYNQLIMGIVKALCKFGLLIERRDRRGNQVSYGVRLSASEIVWKLGEGVPIVDPLRRYKAKGDSYSPVDRRANEFFTDLYKRGPQTLKNMKGAEHTAQINYVKREEREDEFREGKLSCLFCSPTMELGIDIRDLNAVHMRNIPPTPANYAQRSGRSGRAGEPAIVIAYCAFGSGHDQYFFRKRQQMVAGVVVPPQLDLTNESLFRSHIHAIWLANTQVNMKGSIPEVIDTAHDDYPLHLEIQEQIQLSENSFANCLEECKNVVSACQKELENSGWYHADWIEETLRSAPLEFDRAFNRWRELYDSAIKQLDKSHELRMQSYRGRSKNAVTTEDPDRIQHEAERQLNLLCCQNIKNDESDFNPYRYLAGEGFLPGYNFPSIPVRAFISRRSGDGDFIARARFLAITEFGPDNLIYHDGAKYEVNRVFLPSQDSEQRFTRAKLCLACGYAHVGESSNHNECLNCGEQMDGANSQYLMSLLEMPTIGTVRRERITCDEEERLRHGYEVTTHFIYAPSQDGKVQKLNANCQSTDSESILNMSYAPSAELWRINHKWRRKKENGFWLDMNSGKWQSQSVVRNGTQDNIKQMDIRSDVRLYVHKTANMLLIYPHLEKESEQPSDQFLCTLEYALARGIRTVFQVEESELASELIGKGNKRGIMFWEVAEGGLGVLRRLAECSDELSQIARISLEIMHFDPDTGSDLRESDCSRACYDCLLSYYNQRDHKMLDRHLVKDYLLKLAQSTTQATGSQDSYDELYNELRLLTDARSELERKFLEHIYKTKRRLPDFAQHKIEEMNVIPDFIYKDNACIFCDGSVHDQPQQKESDKNIRMQLKDKGYRVIVIRYDRDMEEQIREYSDIFGEGNK
jgi:superfamily II DNA/RNA helicase